MSIVEDLKDGIPELTGLVRNLDISDLLGKLPDVGSLLRDFDPLELLGQVDLSGIVASVGETALDFLGGLLPSRAS